MKRVKVIAAVVVILLLGTFGITNIGGDTWVTANAPLPPGWTRNPSPVVPHPSERSIALPVIMLVALAAFAIFDAVANSPMTPTEDEEEEEPHDSPTATGG